MKVYVEEKNCSNCPFASPKMNFICGDIIAENIGLKNCASICSLNYFATAEQGCPLDSLADHDKEVRKQVCDEIRCKLMENEYSELRDYQGIKYAWFNLPAFNEVLDQIEKGDK